MSLIFSGLGRAIWRRLLQLDQPVPVKTDSEIAAEVEQNYRWNFGVNFLDGMVFWFGFNFVSASTIVPLFVSKLTTSTILIGLVAVLAQAGWSLPQLFTAGYIEKLARKKAVSVNLGFFIERLPVWLWIPAAFLAVKYPTLALLLFFLGFAGFHVGAGIVGPAWQDLIARCFPIDRRGRFFGLTTFVGTGVGAVGAIFSGWLLDVYTFPLNFLYIFFIGALTINISWAFQSLTREPVQQILPRADTSDRFWIRLALIVRQDHNFRHFLYARLLLALGMMGLGFITVAAIQRLQVPDSTVGFYTVALLAGQTSGNLLSGWLADRFGHKLPLEAAGIAAAIAFFIAWLAPSAEWYFVIFAFAGLSIGVTIVSGLLIAMEFSAPERRPTYMGISNAFSGIGNGIAPFVGGLLASFGFGWPFSLSVGLSLVGVVILHRNVEDPRWQSDKRAEEA